MRRAIAMAGLLLSLGLCTSLLVAWAGALVDRSGWPDTPLTGTPTGSRTEMRGWLVEEGRDRTLTWRTFVALDLWDDPPDLEKPITLPAWSVGHGLADQPGPFAPARERTFDEAWEVSAGWPMRCVRAVRQAGPIEFALPGEFVRGGVAAIAVEWPASTSAVAGAGGIAVRPWPNRHVGAILPLRPMPVGVLVNTTVFGLLWAAALLPLAGLRVLRRRRRKRKNRCVACGHSRDGLSDGAPCPECGRDPAKRTTVGELLTARAPMLGATLALVLVVASGSVLATHRWMAVDRLPPLHHAAAVGDAEAIQRLLAGGAAVDELLGELNSVPRFFDHSTPLHWAASRRHQDASQALLDRGADPAVDIFGYQPVVQAIGTGDRAIAELLMSALQPGDELVEVAAVFAYAHPVVQQTLLDRVMIDETDRLELASSAVVQQDLPLLDTLVDEGLSSVGRGGDGLLGRVISIDGRAYARPYRRDLGLMRHVLGLGLEIDPDEAKFAVARAMRSGSLPALEALLAAYPQHADEARRLDGNGLAAAAIYGGAPAIARLIELGADPDAPGVQDMNALAAAAAWVDADAVEILLDAGADPGIEVVGRTLRQWLLLEAEQAAVDPNPDPWSPSLAEPQAFARILDLLEAAEAEWDAREHDVGDTASTGGP